MQLFEAAGLMGSANWVPICFAGSDASDIRWVVPVPGLTGFAITSRRSHNLMEPNASARSVSCGRDLGFFPTSPR
jgi:hypothetical protein